MGTFFIQLICPDVPGSNISLDLMIQNEGERAKSECYKQK